MIDLNMKPKQKPETWEPEEIVCAILAIAIWVSLSIMLGIAL